MNLNQNNFSPRMAAQSMRTASDISAQATPLNTSKVSHGSSFSDRMLRMKPIGNNKNRKNKVETVDSDED